MRDDELTRRLRDATERVEPRAEFVRELNDVLDVRLGFADGRTAGARVGSLVRSRGGAKWQRMLLFAAAIALVAIGLTVAVGAVVDRLDREPNQLERIQAGRVLRVAIRPDHPQVLQPGGTFAGIDVDVANALAERLGVRAQALVVPATDLSVADPTWELALPSGARVASPGFVETAPYYHWPVYVLVDSASPINDVEDLDGSAVCAVPGSAGESWLRANPERPVSVVVSPPTRVSIREGSDDAECAMALAAGEVAAFVTDRAVEADFPTLGDGRILGDGPVATEPRTGFVGASAADASLRDAINEAIEAMQADGTLRALTERRFGGQDLSAP